VIEELLRAAAQPDKNVHNRAVRELAERGQQDPSVREQVVAALGAREARVRMAAARALEPLQGAPCEPLAPLVDDPDASVRGAATKTIAWGLHEPQPAVVAPLLVAACDDVWTVRRWALWGLGKCPGAEPAAAVAAALRDPDPLVRRHAAFASRSVPDLLRALDDPHGGVRWAAANALGRLRAREAVGPLSRRLRRRDRSVRWAAARALGEIGGPEARAGLGALAARVENPSFRRNVESILRHAPRRPTSAGRWHRA
jgi:HEAT repeat protein